MARVSLEPILSRAEVIAVDIEALVPGTNAAISLRADLAGMIVVAMAASYENCVKEVLMNHAAARHSSFGNYTRNQYNHLNSRVSLNDLYGYTKLFDPTINSKFKSLIETRKQKLLSRTGRNFTEAYKQILSWRHDYAHAGIKNTTISEALSTHRLAKRVIYAFDEAFI